MNPDAVDSSIQLMTSASSSPPPTSHKMPRPSSNRRKFLKFFLFATAILASLWAIRQLYGGGGPSEPDHLPAEVVLEDSLVNRERKVKVTVYVESQCPDTTYFLKNTLFNLWQDNQLRSIVDLELVPFGKASWTAVPGGDFSFLCQHGPRECEVNQLMCCAIAQLQLPGDSFAFVRCAQQRSLSETLECSQLSSLNHSQMLDCAQGKRGRQLHQLAGQRTTALVPRLTFVPWVVVDGTSLAQEPGELTAAVCTAYKGLKKPSKCAENNS